MWVEPKDVRGYLARVREQEIEPVDRFVLLAEHRVHEREVPDPPHRPEDVFGRRHQLGSSVRRTQSLLAKTQAGARDTQGAVVAGVVRLLPDQLPQEATTGLERKARLIVLSRQTVGLAAKEIDREVERSGWRTPHASLPRAAVAPPENRA